MLTLRQGGLSPAAGIGGAVRLRPPGGDLPGLGRRVCWSRIVQGVAGQGAGVRAVAYITGPGSQKRPQVALTRTGKTED
jgi:hypothetical protein